MEILICSSSGKPIFYHRRHDQDAALLSEQSTFNEPSENDGSDSLACGLASSLQGLLAYIRCTQHEELQEIHAIHGLRCLFLVHEPLTFTVILRKCKRKIQRLTTRRVHVQSLADDHEETALDHVLVAARCYRRLLELLHAHIRLVLSDRGVDVLRKQPGYDLRDLLHGTEASMRALVGGWSQNPTLRLQDFGVHFVRMPLNQRKEIQKIIESAVEDSANGKPNDGMICGLLLAKQQVVALSQPNPKQFSILTDDLYLLMNFVFFNKSLRKSETWTPVCLPNFNSNGFLYAYVVFITSDICLVLLSTNQKPEQFHRFQAKKHRILCDFEQLQIIRRIRLAMDESAKWRPHHKLSSCIRHFVCRFEQTNECCFPTGFGDGDVLALEEQACETATELDKTQCALEQSQLIERVLHNYAKLYHMMFPHLPATRPAVPTKSWGSFGSSLESRGASSSSSSSSVSSSGVDDCSPSARMMYLQNELELIIGICTEDTRCFVSLEPFLSLAEGNQLALRLVQVLRKEQESLGRMNMRP